MQSHYHYIDAHAHFNFDHFDADREEVINSLKEAGGGAVNVGINLKTSKESLELAEEYEHIWASAGCHPTEVTTNFSIDSYADLVDEARIDLVAVGECGLDYYRKEHRGEKEKKAQKEAFAAQIELALQHDLPLVLHLRPKEGTMDAYEDGLELLEYYGEKNGDNLRGTAHFFVGDEEVARRFLGLGFYLSATGPVTFDETLQRVFMGIPVENILVETDAPFAAPKSHRGGRNSPTFIPEIIAKLAQLKGVDEKKLSKTLVKNTVDLFDLPAKI